MSKSLEDQGRSISKKLSNLAQKLGVNFQDVSTEFLLERMVARLIADNQLAKQLVFKGGYVALRAYNSPRYTVDLDAVLKKGDIDSVLEKAIAAVQIDINDSVWFIWEKKIDLLTQGEYGGKRLVFRGGIGPVQKDLKRAQILNLDIGIGDPIVPGPVAHSLMELLGTNSLSWNIYPIETAAAEKIHTLIVRGSENSRAKDVYDLYLFLEKCDGPTLKKALIETFDYREGYLPVDIAKSLLDIDLSLMKRGWKNAVEDIELAPSFDAAFSKVVSETKRLLG